MASGWSKEGIQQNGQVKSSREGKELAEDITRLEGFVGVNDIILDKIMYIIVERSKILTRERGITRVDQIWGDQGKHTLKY